LGGFRDFLLYGERGLAGNKVLINIFQPTFRSLGKRFFEYERMHVLPVLQETQVTKMRVLRT
jgi:hypothetical protein